MSLAVIRWKQVEIVYGLTFIWRNKKKERMGEVRMRKERGKANKRRWTKVIVALVIGAMCFQGMGPVKAEAYFNRGTVGVSVGRGSVSVEAGSNTSVSVSLSPASDSQLEGCGMAECPQICGEKECLDANGQCTCNGTTYKTYNTSVSVSSSNTSVATASYSGGTLSVHGVSEGTAVITLTASLRQFSSGSTSVKVSVSGRPTQNNGNTSSGSNSSGGGNNSSNAGAENSNAGGNSGGAASAGTGNNAGNAAVANQVSGDVNTVAEETAQEAEAEVEAENPDGVTVVQSDRGTITFVPVKEGKMGSNYLEAVKGKAEYVDFQKKDDAGNILYAWEFLGTDVKDVFDMDFSVASSEKAFEGCKLVKDGQALYLQFAHEGKLPGKAKIFVKVPDNMSEGSEWYLYHYDSKKDTAEELAKKLKVENGYLTIELEECYDCVLSEKEISVKHEKSETAKVEDNGVAEEEPSETNTLLVVGIIILVVLAAGALLVVNKKKKAKGVVDATENQAAEAESVNEENEAESVNEENETKKDEASQS